MGRIPPGYVGVIVKLNGNLRKEVYNSSEIPLLIPWYEKLVCIREAPVRKRFVKEFSCSDGQTIELRIVLSLKPVVHWLPEIYYKFGRDFGRTFMEKEASLDCLEVCRKFAKDELIKDASDKQKIATCEIFNRLDDAARFHKIEIRKEDTIITFVDPEED